MIVSEVMFNFKNLTVPYTQDFPYIVVGVFIVHIGRGKEGEEREREGEMGEIG